MILALPVALLLFLFLSWVCRRYSVGNEEEP